jgi:hypothetical protein
MGAAEHLAFPAPSCYRGRDFLHQLGRDQRCETLVRAIGLFEI